MLVGTGRYKALTARILAARNILTDTTDFGQLELRLAVIALEATLYALVPWHLLILHHPWLRVIVCVWSTSYR